MAERKKDQTLRNIALTLGLASLNFAILINTPYADRHRPALPETAKPPVTPSTESGVRINKEQAMRAYILYSFPPSNPSPEPSQPYGEEKCRNMPSAIDFCR